MPGDTPGLCGAGIGSMPGDDFAESLRMVAGLTPDLVAMPELPQRGVSAAMIGRATGLLADLGADLKPSGWRLTGGTGGVDQRRAKSLLARDLDLLEEHLQGFEGALKVQVAGPWTLAATLERPRGERIMIDHGGRKELAESLAEGLRAHLADVRKRVSGASLLLQIDEPLLPAVLGAQIPTASGWSKHRAINAPEADAALRMFVDVAQQAGAQAVLHSCAPDVPIALVTGAGFDAISFDFSLAVLDDALAEAFESGVDLWPGIVPTADTPNLSDKTMINQLEVFFGRLGFEAEQWAPRTVATPSCGLAGASTAWARRALGLAQSVGAQR